MTQTVREFVRDSYKIVSANSPTAPLQGSDELQAIRFLNELLQYYSGSGQLITVSNEVIFNIITGQSQITFAQTGATVNQGRLANTSDVWLVLQGVTYSLIEVDENEFFSSYKYAPLLGLPIYFVIQPLVNSTNMILYPGPSQGYEMHVYGKFEKTELTATDTMVAWPLYSIRFLKLALARELAIYKSRIEAWSDKHEKFYLLAKEEMESNSQFNLEVVSPNENQLNGAYRVRAGI
jgi:hypothetical protein